MVLVQHHIRYKEIHGVDEIVWMEKGEHHALHDKLRSEGRCNIPVKELHKIALAAHERTEKRQLRRRQNNREYLSKSRRVVRFKQTLGQNIILVERYDINKFTDTVNISSFFEGNNGQKLFVINEAEKRNAGVR